MKFDTTISSNTQVTNTTADADDVVVPPADSDVGADTGTAGGLSVTEILRNRNAGLTTDTASPQPEESSSAKTLPNSAATPNSAPQTAATIVNDTLETPPKPSPDDTLALEATTNTAPEPYDTIAQGAADQEEVRKHAGIADSHDLDKKLSDIHSIEEEFLTKKIARDWHLPYVDLSGVTVESDALILVPQKTAVRAHAAAFKINNKDLSVAIENPNNVDSQAVINQLIRDGYTVTTYMVSPRSMRKLIDRYADIRLTTKSHGGMVDMDASRIATISARIHKNSDINAVITELLARPREQGVTSELMEIIMGSAIATKSSDIHIECQEHAARLRMRQDGVLEDIYEIPLDINKSVASRIKILSGLKLTVTKDAQDGRFTVTFDGVQIEIRVSTIPGPYGEGIVMRILDPRGLTVSFERLGIEPKLMEVFMREIAKPEGIILTTGPTGSGKTTTLYSFLQSIYDPEIKIVTIEDPIEYHLAGIQQTQVDHTKGYDFLSGLRAAMRQDPEVIMVGEIRDAETAITAVQAAQTGHLVLSTLHTNNAAGVIPRLLVLGVNPSLLASTLRLAIAQRLVRRLVPETRIERLTTPDELTIIHSILGNAIAGGKDITRFGFAHDAPSYTVYDADTSKPDEPGYKGRIGLFEAIFMDTELEKLLEGNPSEREVRETAIHQGLLTMQEDAIIKILQGVTSFEEVTSAIDLGVETMHAEPNHDTHPEHMSFTNPLPNFHMDTAQLETMWNYLKTLKSEQELLPTDERAEQIRDTESIIMDIMKRNHGINNASPQNTSALIQNEVKDIEQELAELREHALKHPDPEIAAKLKQMHAMIENI